MEKLRTIKNLRLRKLRVRTRIKGTSERPRMTVTISNKHISAQIIDDSIHKTLVASSSVGNKKLPTKLSERAVWVGSDIAKKAIKLGVKKISFDRNGRKYHGRIAFLADAARKEGLEF